MIIHSKSHLICLAAGLRSDPLHRRRTHSIRETPTLRDRERVLKKVGQIEGWENKGKEKSIVVAKNLILLSLVL